MNIDDPKLTAYALDELDPAQRAEVEALLREDPKAAAEVRQIREFSTWARTVLAAEAAPALEEKQREELMAEAAAPNVVVLPPRRSRGRVWVPTAIAACLFVSVGYFYFYKPETIERRQPVAARMDGEMAGQVTPAGEASKNEAEVAKEQRPGYQRFPDAPAPPPVSTPTDLDSGTPAVTSKSLALPVPAASPAPAPPKSGFIDQPYAELNKPSAPEIHEPPQIPQGFGDNSRLTTAPASNQPSTPTTPSSFDKPAETPVSGGGLAPGRGTLRMKRSEVPGKAKIIGAHKTISKDSSDALRQREAGNTDSYDAVTDNPFLQVSANPLSTFSVDVDTASYANVRRMLNAGERPPKGAVRIEELVNYFTYDYPQPKEGEPFSVNMEVATCPWAPAHRLLRVGLKAREIRREERPVANLVFLIDVSGSMQPANKLPLVKESLRLLTEQLGPKDTVAIAVYAGASGTVLEPTSDKGEIRAALDRLEAGGSTNGADGLRLAYQLARRSFEKEKSSRVILATDGDFNVGVTNQSDLVDLITKEAKSGVFLTVLGFGYGNLKDSTMEKLADKGNGNYAYIDTLAEGRRVLVEQIGGTLFTVAKDVKIQVEFNPSQVSGYRLIGYESRLLAKEDFNDDRKDAGEVGAGHTVTALYELVPAGAPMSLTSVDELKYQPRPVTTAAPAAATTAPSDSDKSGEGASGELLTLKLRWKAPQGETSTLREFPLRDSGLTWEKSTRDFRWAAAVASFGMLLRDSEYKGSATWDSTQELALEGRGEDRSGYRGEFLSLLAKARR